LILQIDGLMSTRGTENQTSQNTSDRLITCLLTELDGLQSKKEGDGVFILAATSRKEAIDTAILRPGRIGVHFEMPPFDNEMRLALIEEKIKMMPIDLDSNQIEWIVEKTAGLLPADFDGLFREAALATLRKDFDSQRITFDTLCAQINSSL
jgi:transitional endoplasmic reticulum ATPase